RWWGDHIISNLFKNIGDLFVKWLGDFMNNTVASGAAGLGGGLQVFVLNPNIRLKGMDTSSPDKKSTQVIKIEEIVFTISIHLLLLIFLLCIWSFWTDTAWKGEGHHMGAVGRLICTTALLLAWPTIFTFDIQITNEMTKAIYWQGSHDVQQLDQALSTAIKI